MSKPVKEMIVRMYRDLFDGVTDVALIDIRGLPANDNNALRTNLLKKKMQVTVVRNALARKAFENTGLSVANDMIEGPTAVVVGESAVSIARELVEAAKKYAQLQLKGAVMEGLFFGPDRFEELSKYPTREEAQAQVIQVILGPAGQLLGTILGAGSGIASLVEAVEKKLEKGEEIKKIA